MNLAQKKKMETFGNNFATYKTENWKSCYEATTKKPCHFIKLSNKNLQKVLDRIYYKNMFQELKFLKLNPQLANIPKKALLHIRKHLS